MSLLPSRAAITMGVSSWPLHRLASATPLNAASLAPPSPALHSASSSRYMSLRSWYTHMCAALLPYRSQPQMAAPSSTTK